VIIVYKGDIMMKRLLVLLIVLGMAFSIYPNSGLAADDVSAMYGDLNGDGSVNSIDYAIMKSYLIGIRSNFPVLNGEVVGDVNADNSVNSIDYAFIKSYLLGLISEFPAEKTRPLTTPAPQEEAIYEAEDAALYNSFLETIHSGFSGSGYVNYNNEYGSYVEWKVNVAKNGAYKLIFRYANGANTNRAMSISVNKKIARNSLDFNPKGSWTSWSESYIVVKLDQGDNLIRATAITADGGPNVDYLKVMSTNEPVMTPDPTTAQTPAPTPKNETPVPSSSTTIPAGAIIVDKSGRGNYTTVQAAVNSLGSKSSDAKTIYIKNGNYKEVVTIPNGISNLTIIGESKENVIIHYDNYNGKSNGSGGTYGTSGSASVFIKGSDITVHNITFMNSFEEKGNSNEQAVALSATGNRIKFNNCIFRGNQDTLLCDGGTQYFYKCLIEGDVDFIFGRSQAVFEECEIRSLNRGSKTNNGYITAARTDASAPYGFVFINCRLTCEWGTAANSVWLGRPWCPNGTDVNKPAVAYINCYMDAHIKTEGWTSMSGVDPSHGRFYEYNSWGSGAAKNSSRPQLTAAQAANYTKINVLGGWNPSF